jgi:hypothetical protein
VSDPRDMSVDDEEQLYRELAASESRRNSYRATATPDLSDITNRIVQNVPHIEPGVALSIAQGITNGQISYDDGINLGLNATKAQIETTPQEPEQGGRGFFGRIVDGAQETLKSGVKWGVAGLEFVPQIVTNVASRVVPQGGTSGAKYEELYQAPKTDFWDGLVASTDLGALMSGVESGNGYFIGEAAFERQQQAAKDYRGTIDGEAWTIGRGFATTFTQPGSREYNILSGIVDAAAAIAIPSIPGGKAISKGATKASDLAGLRRVSGLTDFATPYIQRSKVNSWLETGSGRAVIDRIQNVTTMDEAKSLFPKADRLFHSSVIDANSFDEVNTLLQDSLGLAKPGLYRVDDMKIGMLDDARRKVSLSPRFSGRLSAVVPGREFVVDAGDTRALTKTVDNADSYMKTVRIDAKERNKITKRLTDALGSNNRAEARIVLKDLEKRVINAVVETSGPLARKIDRQFVEQMFGEYRKNLDEFVNYGYIDDAGDAAVIDGLTYEVKNAAGDIEVRKGGGVKDTAHLSTEVKKFSTFFPDPRALRRVSSQYSWLWTKSAQNPEVFGDARTFVTALDFVQNKVWRPLTLVTGGYMFRNMLESIMRQTTARGVASGPTHPMQWIQSMMGYTHIGDLEGTRWLGEAGRLSREANKEFFEATGAKIRELQDPVYLQERAIRTGRFALAKRTDSPSDYARGVATEIRLLAGDDVARRLARNESIDDIVNNFLTQPQGNQYVQSLQSRWTNRKIVGSDGAETQGTVKFINADGTYDADNLKAYVKSVEDRLHLKTGSRFEIVDGKKQYIANTGYESLRQAIANSEPGFLGGFVGRNGKQSDAFRQVNVGAKLEDGYEPFEYSQDFLDEIAAIASDADVRLPEYVKLAPRLEDQVIAGKSKANWFDQTTNHFFSSVFGKKEAFLNRSPVFRQYYYRKINDLVNANELSPEALARAYEAVAEGGYRYFNEKVDMLSRLKPNANNKYTWDGRDIGERAYKKLVSDAQKDLTKAKKRVAAKGPDAYEILDDDWAARYVGSKELWQKIKDARSGKFKPATTSRTRQLEALTPDEKGRYLVDGKLVSQRQYDQLLIASRGLSLEEASFAAKAFAMEETKRVFYNAAEVNNFTDIMRIAIPFGPAWGEAMRFYGKEVITKPNRAKNLAVSVQGVRDADPDGDGRGFFYKDPVSGEMLFNYPFSTDLMPFIGAGAGAILFETLFGRGRSSVATAGFGALGGLGLGIIGKQVTDKSLGDASFQLQAPAQSLSQSFQVLPGFGPVIQMSAAKLLGNKPEFDDVLSVISPFGSYEDPLSSVVPSWAQKLSQAITADPENDRYFADLYIESFRAIYATGEYDNTDSTQMQELRKRAGFVAKTLLVLRSLGQFVGPARPEPELLVPTKFEGDVTVKDVELFVQNNVPASILASVFRTMQEEDYENAVVNFLQTFGSETMMYMPGLSNSNVQGLQATDVFGDWERRNKDVIEAFPTVYGYFATSGGEFELQTYLRQLRSGARDRITDPAILQQDAEALVGKALYIQQVRELGDDLSDRTAAELRQYRTDLENRLPGFKYQPLNINERQQILAQIIDASENAPSLQGNAVARSVRTYNGYREQALAVAIQRNDGVDTGSLLTRKENADLRQWLRKVGDTLTSRPNSQFERVWTRVFFDEVDF